MGDALEDVDLGTGRTAVSITAGDLHTCAVLDDGSLKVRNGWTDDERTKESGCNGRSRSQL